MTNETEQPTDEITLMTQRARATWDERLGSTVANARNWRLACFSALGIALLAVGGITWIGGQSKIQPYALAIQGDNVLPMPAMQRLSDTQLQRLYAQSIRDFIESSRTVVMDVQAQKNLVMRAYRYLRPQTPAHTQLTSRFKNEPPFARAEKELVKIEINSVLPIADADHAWQVEWTETISDRTGTIHKGGVKHFKASVLTEVVTPTTRQAVNANPLGFYITSFNDVEVN